MLGLAMQVVFGCTAVSGIASAARIPWNDATVAYAAKGRPLKQVLKDVLATQKFPTVITGDIRGDVRGQFNESAAAVFRQLEAAYDFVWFFDGAVLYISPGNDIRSEVIPVGALGQARAERMLERLGLLEERFPVKVSGGGAFVSGPARYVELVGKALRAESAAAPARSPASGGGGGARAPLKGRRVRVFPLKFAQATDVTRTIGDNRYVIPGVATLLRRLDDGDGQVMLDQPDDAPEERDTRGGDPLTGILQRRPARTRAVAGRTPSSAEAARVEADARTNSVIVHAEQALLDSYADVIERLDRPQRLVQLDVTIIEIAASAVRDLGVSLGVKHPRFQGSTGGVSGDPAGLAFQAVIGTSARHIAARIAALEQAGKARVLSRPTLVVLENVEAALGNRNTAYVRVAGAYQTDLYPVQAGLQVRAMPRAVLEEGLPDRIQLNLDIVDGYLDQAQKVDGIPTASESAINTQALVESGQTLLIGGHQYENIGNERTGVPGLSKMPVIGALFRHTRGKQELREHMFLITPRLVDAPLDPSILPALTAPTPRTLRVGHSVVDAVERESTREAVKRLSARGMPASIAMPAAGGPPVPRGVIMEPVPIEGSSLKTAWRGLAKPDSSGGRDEAADGG